MSPSAVTHIPTTSRLGLSAETALPAAGDLVSWGCAVTAFLLYMGLAADDGRSTGSSLGKFRPVSVGVLHPCSPEF